MNADVQFDSEIPTKKNMEELTDENANAVTKMDVELPQNSLQEIESNETNNMDTTVDEIKTETTDLPESETNLHPESKVEEEIVVKTTEKVVAKPTEIVEVKTTEEIVVKPTVVKPTEKAIVQNNDDFAVEPTPTAKPDSIQEVASVNDRLNVYENNATDVTKSVEKPAVGKIGSVDKFKQNYLKKADAPVSGNSTPTSEITSMTPPGTMSLRDRMKMFENKDKPARIHARETVSHTEKASNIRNKISMWGQSDSGGNSNINQREKIHVGSISERRNNYSNSAKI